MSCGDGQASRPCALSSDLPRGLVTRVGALGSKMNRQPALAFLEISAATAVDRARAFALSGLAPEPMAKARVANTDLDRRRVAPEGRFRQPRLYVVGEAPGVEEAAQRRPFVGPAGRALREMLDEAGSTPNRCVWQTPFLSGQSRIPKTGSPVIAAQRSRKSIATAQQC